MQKTISIRDAAGVLGKSESQLRRLCTKGKYVGVVKKDGQWEIPIDADARLRGLVVPKDYFTARQLQEIPLDKQQDAQRKLGHVKAAEKFAASHVRAGGSREDALSRYAAENGLKSRSLYRWVKTYRQGGVLALVDRRGRSYGFETISPDAWELFKSFWLSQAKPSVRDCWAWVKYTNTENGHNWVIPALRTMQKLAKEKIPYPMAVLHREGVTAYEAKCAPYIHKDIDSIEPGEVWVGDHHQFNCWIRHRGQWVRPWITAWEDMRSRALVGWDINVGPNQTTILQAMKVGIEAYGPPRMAKIDNGKDYDSHAFTGTTKKKRRAKKAIPDEALFRGLYDMLGVAVSFAIPYNAKAKPIERFFDTLDQQFIKTIPTYCGKDAKRKPDKLDDYMKTQKAIQNAFSLETFEGKVVKFIKTIYNQTAHGGDGMNGLSPAEVMAQRTTRRVLMDGVVDLLLKVWSGPLKIGKNGVRFKGLYYGQYDTDLLLRQGQKVRVAYDYKDLRQVHVYDDKTLKLITIAEQNRLVAYGAAATDEDLREAMRQKNKATKIVKSYSDHKLTAGMDLTTLAIKARQAATRPTPEPPSPIAATIRPVSTPLDDQIAHHERLENQQRLRRAVGAETVKDDLDIDLSILNRRRSHGRLFGD